MRIPSIVALTVIVAGSLGILGIQSGAAATIDEINGRVALNQGHGFKALSGTTAAAPGSLVVAGPRSSAVVIYSQRCRVPVAPGRAVRVARTSPCRLAGRVEHHGEGRGFDRLTAIVFAGAAGMAILDRLEASRHPRPASP
jgi:hypothetical protein